MHAAIPVSRNFAQLREALGRSPIPATATTRDHRSFQANVAALQLGGVRITYLQAARHTVEHSEPPHADLDDSGFVLFCVVLEGKVAITQDDRTAVLEKGDVALYESSRGYRVENPCDVEVLMLAARADTVDFTAAALAKITARRQSSENPHVRIVTPMVRQFARNLEHLHGPAGKRVAQSAVDLLTTVFLSAPGQEAPADRAELRLSICDYIDRNLHRSDLSVAEIAAAHHLSVRTLHKIFAQGDTTVARFIRVRRLEACSRALESSDLEHQTISDIADGWGFSDAAHFSRLFSARFGMSPRAYRVLHRTSLRETVSVRRSLSLTPLAGT